MYASEYSQNYIERLSNMAGGDAEAILDINIDTKRSSTTMVRKALFRATREEKWMVNDEWAYFLVRKAPRFIFHGSYTKLLERTVLYL
jgi:hypothetical protein